MAQGFVATGNHILDGPGISIESRRAFRSVERGKATAGPSANVNQPATVADGFGNRVDGQCDLGQSLLYGPGDLLVFIINNAGDLERGLGVQVRGSAVGLLRPEFIYIGVA